jgi:hypothetical protein
MLGVPKLRTLHIRKNIFEAIRNKGDLGLTVLYDKY